ncbi:MAG: aldo/keto reductase, partial [Terracoccus sp.]
IDLYQWHRPDRSRVYGEVIETFKALQDEGKIRAVGISNANIEVLGEGGLASVQNEFSPRFRSSRNELEHCGRKGIAFLPWSPLGGTGGGSKRVGQTYPVFQEIGQQHAVSPQQVVIAWELSLGDHVIPIPGASRPPSISDSAKAVHLTLTEDELTRIESQFR